VVAALGYGAPYDARSANALLAGLSWNFAKWGDLSLSASQSSENGATAERARTTALGVAAHVGFGGGWVTTLSYHQASTQLSLNPVVSNVGESILHSQSYGIAVAKQGLFGHDALGLSLSRPASSYNNAPMAANQNMQFQFYGRDKLFAGAMPETDIEVGYITSFLDGPVALQANASYQVNYNGLNKDELSFVSRAKIKF
jgi:hypothetical protein